MDTMRNSGLFHVLLIGAQILVFGLPSLVVAQTGFRQEIRSLPAAMHQQTSDISRTRRLPQA